MPNENMPNRKIGLIAGWGNYPIVVAKALKSQGFEVYCLGILGHVDPALADICDHFRIVGMGRMGGQTRYLRRNGVAQATMAGKIFKTLIFRRFDLLSMYRHLPDFTFLKHFYPVLVTKSVDRRDDTILTLITELYRARGVEFLPATDFAPELLVNEGCLTTRRPSSSQIKDIRFGWEMAKQLGRLDIGQSVVVKNQAVLAVEAIEGTDECVQRAGVLCPSGGFSLIKVAKPNQDMRFDVPTIGCGTIETLHAAGGRLIAIEANKTIVLEQEKVVQLANRLGVVLISCHADAIEPAKAIAG